jgi:hypothetical protein
MISVSISLGRRRLNVGSSPKLNCNFQEDVCPLDNCFVRTHVCLKRLPRTHSLSIALELQLARILGLRHLISKLPCHNRILVFIILRLPILAQLILVEHHLEQAGALHEHGWEDL